MLKLTRFLKNYKLQLILGPIFKLIDAIFELIVPLVMIKIIDVGVAGHDISYVLRMGGLLVVLGATGLISALTCQYFASVASMGSGCALRASLYRKIGSLSSAELDKFGAGGLITRLTNDVNQLQQAVAMLIRLVIRAPFLAVGSMFMAFSIDATLSLVFLVALPLVALVLFLIMSRSVPFYKVIQKKLDKVGELARERLAGERVIRAFGKQSDINARFSVASDDLADTGVHVSRLSALLNPLTFAIANLGIVAILWLSGARVSAGTLTTGEVIALVNYMTQVLLALVVVANLVVTFTRANASASRINEVFDTRASVYSAPNATLSPIAGAPAIEFQNVSFSYSGAGTPALCDVSFSVESGKTLGIIGGTGSGKSTLAALIARFYNASCGSVRISGQDVSEMPLTALRRMVRMVMQNSSLISGNIAKNLRFGDADATDDELMCALKTAQAADFVSQLPDGLSARVEEGGKNFSGGQRQRLSIARALVGSPKILVLDDCSSALDLATDARLRRALREDTGDACVIMISQRVSAVKSCDSCLVLDDGNVVGFGTHDELIASCPVYREICASQLGNEEVPR